MIGEEEVIILRVRCRAGSSENVGVGFQAGQVVRCRAGSSETEEAGGVRALHRSLPRRQLRKDGAADDVVGAGSLPRRQLRKARRL